MKNTDVSNRKVPVPLPSTVFAMNTATAVTWKKRIITSITIVIIINTTTGNKIITMNIIIIIIIINIPITIIIVVLVVEYYTGQAKRKEVRQERLHQALLLYF